MNIHNKSSLITYWTKHNTAKKPLELWWFDVSSKGWKKPNDVKKDYASASIIGNNRIVFNIKGNDFRLIVEFNYQKGRGFIKFIGTHAEYDKIDAEQIELYKGKKKTKKST
ncbi:MAG: type II toxin-antitoxin system HigB family toxin [Crocinitomicaceae bacterium]|nr:type II toxin-antitoxin system HigB family toxin [Crocinitomicaceae bacterium]MBK8924529.1 type II toxin-antitoxin system HigB family toxin [Crocinitomicaceae bacterium]